MDFFDKLAVLGTIVILVYEIRYVSSCESSFNGIISQLLTKVKIEKRG